MTFIDAPIQERVPEAEPILPILTTELEPLARSCQEEVAGCGGPPSPHREQYCCNNGCTWCSTDRCWGPGMNCDVSATVFLSVLRFAYACISKIFSIQAVALNGSTASEMKMVLVNASIREASWFGSRHQSTPLQLWRSKTLLPQEVMVVQLQNSGFEGPGRMCHWSV